MSIHFEKTTFESGQVEQGRLAAGQGVALSEPGHVLVQAHPDAVEAVLRAGDDLVITIDGKVITIEDFYLSEENQLQFVNEEGTMLWDTTVYPTQGSAFVPVDYVLVASDEAAVAAATSSAAISAGGSSVGLWAAAGLLAVGAGAAAIGGGGSGGSSSSGQSSGNNVSTDKGVADEVASEKIAEKAPRVEDAPSSDGDGQPGMTSGLAPDSDTGVSGDRITSNSQPVILGDGATAGDTVRLYAADGQTVMAQGFVENDGSWWMVPDAPLSEGENSLVVGFMDASDNARALFQPMTIMVDTQAPEAAHAAPQVDAPSDSGTMGDDLTNDMTPTLMGMGGAPGDTVTLYGEAGGDVLGTAIVAADGSWTVSPTTPFSDGTYDFRVSYTDTAGNESALSPVKTVEIDCTGPEAPSRAPLLAAVSDSGETGDEITNDGTPTLIGAGGTPGDTVTLYDAESTTVLASGTVAADGNWSVTPDVVLVDGTYSFSVSYTDAAGNESDRSPVETIVIDSQASGAPTDAPTLVAASDSGIAGDNVTSDTTPTLSGAGGTAGDVVTLYGTDGLTVLGSSTISTDGSWLVAPGVALTDGIQELSVTYTDAAGNESSQSASVEITIDTSAPTAPSSAPLLATASDSGTTGDNITSDNTPSLTGSGGSEGDIVTLYGSDGETVLGVATVTADGSWAVAPDAVLADGNHELSVSYTDAAGNESSLSAIATIVIDSQAPGAPDNAPALTSASDTETAGDNVTSDTTPTLSGAGGTAGDVVTLYGTDGLTVLGSSTVSADGSWVVTPELALKDGIHELSVTYTDAAGNESSQSASLQITIDSAAPDAPAGSPSLALVSDSGEAGDNITADSTPTVTGNGGVAGDTVTLYGTDGVTVLGSATVAVDGSWAVTPEESLVDGTYDFSISYTDQAGNESPLSTSVQVTVDTSAPTAPSSAPSLAVASDSGVTGDHITSDTTPTLIGAGGTSGDTVTIFGTDGVTVLATTTVTSDGSWAATPDSELADGVYDFSVSYTDAAGNESAPSASLQVTVDTSAPTAPSGAPSLAVASDSGVAGDNITSDDTPFLTGTGGSAGDTVTLYGSDGTTVLGAATVTADGTWSVTPDAALADGSYDFSVSYTDVAGNESDRSSVETIVIDSQAPGTPDSAPVLTLASDTGIAGDNVTSDTTPTFSGVGGIEGETVTFYGTDGTTVLGTTSVSADGSWAITPDSGLADGVHDLSVSYTDAAGNESAPSASLQVTVDTVGPVSPEAPSLAASSDSGDIGDSLTSDNTPTLTGAGGIAGETVTLYGLDGVTVIGTAVVAGDGTWAIIPEESLADGTYDFSVSYTDLAGNESPLSTSVQVTVDTTVPAAPSDAPSLAVASDSGVVGDNITSDTTPILIGTGGTSEDTVTIFGADGVTVLATTTVTSDGSWAATPDSELADGIYDFSVSYTDAAGNESAPSDSVQVTVDTMAPAAPLIALADDTGPDSTDGTTNNGQVVVSGLEAGSTWEYSVDGGLTWGEGSGIGFTLDDGTYAAGDVQVKQTDMAGHVSTAGTNAQTLSVGSAFVESASASVSEGGLVEGLVTATGQVSLGDPDGDTVSVTLYAPSKVFASDGEPVVWSGNGTSVLIGSTSAGEAVRVSIDDSGNYTFTLSQPLDHPVANSADQLDLAFEVRATDGSDVASEILTVTLTDDTPVVDSANINHTVSEPFPATVSGNALGDDGYFGEDGGAVRSVEVGGLRFNYDVSGNTVDSPTGVSEVVSGYSYDEALHELTVTTVPGETIVVDTLTASYSYSATGISTIVDPANAAPTVSTGSGTNPGLLGGDVLGLIDLSADQSVSVNDPDNNLVSVMLTYDVLGLTTGLGFNVSNALAQEMGVDVVTYSDSDFLLSTASISFTASDGGVLDLLKINEILGTVTFDPGLVSVGLTSTVTLTATDQASTSGSESDTGLLDVNLLNLSLIDTSPASNIQEGSASDDVLTGDIQSDKNDRLYGHGGNDALAGGDGNDILRGGDGQDTLNGGLGNDVLVGGAGADNLAGGDGIDVFLWESDKGGNPGSPELDTVDDFSNLTLAEGGDIIDLGDLLEGEGAIGTNPGNLAGYLHFEVVGGDTILNISTSGDFTGGYDSGAVDQRIQFSGVDLTGGQSDDQSIIANLLQQGKLIVDQASSTTVFNGGYTDLGITVADGDGDTARVDIRFDQSGLDSPAPSANVAPDVLQGEGALLGLVGVSALNLIDFSNQGLNASDRDGNLQTVEVAYTSLATIDLGSLGSTPGLTCSQTLANELGIVVDIVNDPGILGLVLPSSTLTINAADGGNLDNVEVNELLATVTFEQDLSLLSDIARAEVLNSTTITATDDQGASSASSLGELATVNLLHPLDTIQLGEVSADTFIGSADDDRLYGFEGNDWLVGAAGNDIIRGGEGDDVLDGGEGSDILIGGPGADTLLGGVGDDLLVIQSSGFVSLDGGDGFDSLQLSEGIDLNLDTASVGSISSIERIDLVAGDAGCELTLTEDALVSLTSAANEIEIVGDSNDTLNVSGAILEESGREISGAVFDVYAFGSSTLFVDSDVDIVA